ncbi:flagellar hook-length control protein FliK [Sphingopyxis sp.]|jgi:flagellar hook-length control protein FliK|uniref:flagellar hook-length control protein FliK n=1 Tax=Sphingopyxis sp. TaxID=1908224 RepID=UPI002E044E7F|nr:flagellar hook-length control protein FliK [Sphingopyxis sp.]
MMGAPSLPTPQSAMPAGFAAFLANIGQVPDGTGEGAGFDQLLAAAPVAAAPIAGAAATIRIAPAAQPAEAALPQTETAPVPDKADTAAQSAATNGEADAAALAANLLVMLNGATPGTRPTSGKPVQVEVEAEADTATETAPNADTSAATPAANWAAVVAAAIPAAARTAKPAATPGAAKTDTAPTLPIAPRPQAAALPAPALPGAEAPAARPVEAAPSMTILFTQPATQGAATLAEPAAPALVAERVLDMDSDGAWIDQLARDIAATKSDNGDISFRLMPKHLGRLDVAMQMGDEGVSLKMDTRHEATATIVTAAQGKLVDELRQQGVRVAGAEVTCTPGETGRQSQSQGRTGAPDAAHLIETATERAEPRDEDRAADRRGRFA